MLKQILTYDNDPRNQPPAKRKTPQHHEPSSTNAMQNIEKEDLNQLISLLQSGAKTKSSLISSSSPLNTLSALMRH